MAKIDKILISFSFNSKDSFICLKVVFPLIIISSLIFDICLLMDEGYDYPMELLNIFKSNNLIILIN